MTKQEKAIKDITNRIEKYKTLREGAETRKLKIAVTQKIRILEYELNCVMGGTNETR